MSAWSVLRLLALDAWREDDHPRGQPKNAGQFAKKKASSAPKARAGGERHKGLSALASARPGKVKVQPPSLDRQIEMTKGLHRYMRMVMKSFGGNGQLVKDKLLIEKGTFYPVTARSYEGRRGKPKMCFMNATHDALQKIGRTYVEGYIIVHGVPIHHAWTVDEEGTVYDSTIHPSGEVGGYYGIPFTRDYLTDSILKNKYYGLLGYSSQKTLEPLLKGEVPESQYKQSVNLDRLSDDVVSSRMKYAEAVLSDIEPTDQINTPERQEMRRAIADKVYNRGIGHRARERKCTIILGLPGAGKSSIIKPLLKAGYLELDADLAKEEIPEFHGGAGANAVHEESSAINRSVLERAIGSGDNIAWARIDSIEKITKDVTNLRKLGYTVNVTLVDVTPETATKSAIERFLNTNRYVSPGVVKSYGNSATETFDEINASGLVNESELYRREFGKGPVKVR